MTPPVIVMFFLLVVLVDVTWSFCAFVPTGLSTNLLTSYRLSTNHLGTFPTSRVGYPLDGLGQSRRHRGCLFFFSSASDGNAVDDASVDDGGAYQNENPQEASQDSSRPQRMRQKVASLAKNIVVRPIASAAPVPRAIAAILKDATVGAVDLAIEEVVSRRSQTSELNKETELNINDLIDEAFAPMEASLEEMEQAMAKAKSALQDAKSQAAQAVEAVQAAAIAQAEDAAVVMAAAEEVASRTVMADLYNSQSVDFSNFTYNDVDYHETDMAPPFLDDDQCLVPGEAVVRVERAPENSRRIFAGIDIPVGVDAVWEVLTDYENLSEIVPNLVQNDVLERYDGVPLTEIAVDTSLSEEAQCETISKQLKGALLRQIGGAKVVGIKFSARTTLEVREWPQGIPDPAHFEDEVFEGKNRVTRAEDNTSVEPRRYRFPRPFALSTLPSRDISMQSIESNDGEFRLYQGVWRMQPLPGCAPPGQASMRLTYAVEISPRAYLPVSLIEGRIVKDLCTNLVAIRDYVTARNVATV